VAAAKEGVGAREPSFSAFQVWPILIQQPRAALMGAGTMYLFFSLLSLLVSSELPRLSSSGSASCPASIHGIVGRNDRPWIMETVTVLHVHVHVHVSSAPDALVHAHAHAHAMFTTTTPTTAAASSPRKPPQAPPSRLVHHGPALPGHPGPMVSGPISS
jgi:hypothetical protein